MDEIRRWDRKLLLQCLLHPKRVIFGVLGLALAYLLLPNIPIVALVGAASILVVWLSTSLASAKRKRFRHLRFAALWQAAQDRHSRFQAALKAANRAMVATGLTELPKTIQGVSETLYVALRRADVVFDEILKSEGAQAFVASLAPPVHIHGDAQATELYRIADKNIAEYKQQYQAVMGGVQRTEAQAAVFTTTLDALRVKLLGYRLTGRQPDQPSKEFLESITEAKMQFEAIDKALEDLELTPWPKTVAVIESVPEQELRS